MLTEEQASTVSRKSVLVKVKKSTQRNKYINNFVSTCPANKHLLTILNNCMIKEPKNSIHPYIIQWCRTVTSPVTKALTPAKFSRGTRKMAWHSPVHNCIYVYVSKKGEQDILYVIDMCEICEKKHYNVPMWQIKDHFLKGVVTVTSAWYTVQFVMISLV